MIRLSVSLVNDIGCSNWQCWNSGEAVWIIVTKKSCFQFGYSSQHLFIVPLDYFVVLLVIWLKCSFNTQCLRGSFLLVPILSSISFIFFSSRTISAAFWTWKPSAWSRMSLSIIVTSCCRALQLVSPHLLFRLVIRTYG